MNTTIAWVALGLVIPFLGTALGSAFAFFIGKEMKPGLQKALLGFASGVMIAASVWSLLIPSLEMAEQTGAIPWVPAAVGFLLGVGFLLLIDTVTPHLHPESGEIEGPKAKISRVSMLTLAVTIHNIPEGMAVGVVFAGMLSGQHTVTLMGALALSIGIAIQNIPEGAIIAAPLRANGASRSKAFLAGVLSGVVEPLGALLTLSLTAYITGLLPYFLSFAAGAMIYVVVEELIPETQTGEHSNLGIIGCALGFVLMMVLDVALG